jgi:hypothetical protein
MFLKQIAIFLNFSNPRHIYTKAVGDALTREAIQSSLGLLHAMIL